MKLQDLTTFKACYTETRDQSGAWRSVAVEIGQGFNSKWAQS